MAGSFTGHRFVIGQLAKRAILGRYRGTILGLLWSLVTPLLLLAVYTFVFGSILQVRWVTQSGGNAEFAAILFSGMLIHGILAECLTQASTLIVTNPQYVKKVVFPLEALPWVTVISAFFQGVISTGILLVYLLAVEGSIPWTAVLFPIPLLVLVFVCIAAGWLIAATAVYLKDIAQMMGLLSTVLFFMAPILYPKSALPAEFQHWLYLNPLTYIIEQFRAVVLWGQLPDWKGLGLYTLAAVVIAWLSLAWFQKTRKGFADVL
ncbi:MAG TPA: sugar ABC transporter permease [Gammaproteobacteria bacterium]|nr:sugar ABC transporter permease [Gammaproteobacteria bacterium]